ncbi:hypothetical protein M378DRAFT_203201 [Amanita muscaria Koide BX008]|uniref:Uncharacterized protein n=1 Tax=Amanita muscaria (strain Koide BX008) TaxID=946122 RepID=A0A0C2TV08_AMAMK|nr:hypothetical protein M378DRAFT_203201 [Amanita muscaria Koide BX008]
MQERQIDVKSDQGPTSDSNSAHFSALWVRKKLLSRLSTTPRLFTPEELTRKLQDVQIARSHAQHFSVHRPRPTSASVASCDEVTMGRTFRRVDVPPPSATTRSFHHTHFTQKATPNTGFASTFHVARRATTTRAKSRVREVKNHHCLLFSHDIDNLSLPDPQSPSLLPST